MFAAPLVVAGAWWLVRLPPPPVETMIPVAPTAPVSADSGASVPLDTLDVFDPLAPLDTLAPQVVTVHVVGAVNEPGVYHLAVGARGDDALRAAGGARSNADLRLVNLAAPLVDGEQLVIPRIGERPPPTTAASRGGSGGTGAGRGGPGESPGDSGPTRTTLPLIIDINRANADELDRLPGIGPKTAKAIVEHRTRNGPFASVDDLLAVRGIGPATLAEIRNWVKV
ncbi:MAG: ComEA family DNA-binding protein [Acidimicrobiia bacterium]